MEKILKYCHHARVLIIGDVILDYFVHGRVERISPEAPIPVLLQTSRVESLGGAGNVARNIVSVGAQASIIALIGKDNAGRQIEKICKKHKINGLFHPAPIPTTTKTRFVANGQQMLRVDGEEIWQPTQADQAIIIERINQAINDHDIVVLSDYGKGFLSTPIIQHAIKTAKNHHKMVIIDPKGDDYAKYSGADYITPNRAELKISSKMPTDSKEKVIAAAQHIMQQYNIGAVLATRSEQGLSLIQPHYASHFATNARQVFDVSGAGDTVVALFAVALSVGIPPILAARIANGAGGVVVEKTGTAFANLAEIGALLHESAQHNAKLTNLSQLKRKIARWRADGKKIVFTNGCFDLLHDGHLDLLQQARAAGDVLIIGLNTDSSVQLLKGKTRPINSFSLRADMLYAQDAVDAIIGFADETPFELIRAIAPDVLVKGKDYENKAVVGSEFAGRVWLADLKPGFSSTNIINGLHDE